MTLFLIALIAGVLTVLAPCILPLLPVIVGSSVADGGGRRGITKALIITGSLGLSVILFTFLLKVSTLFVTLPEWFWPILSGSIILVFGVITLFPGVWENLPFVSKLSARSNALLGSGYQKKSFWGDVLIGASLGPVFTTCSPTYFIVLATVLPVSFVTGVVYLLAYATGLCVTLLGIAYVGQKILSHLGTVVNPRGWFKRGLGILFIVVGIAILTGFDKTIETAITKAGFFDVTKIEHTLLTAQERAAKDTNVVTSDDEKIESAGSPSLLTLAQKKLRYPKAPELVNPDGYINTEGLPITLGQYVGKKVVLLDIWTYSCINCQRTLPYLTSWYTKYEDHGLVIIGVHTPEFAFEKVQRNVEDAVQRFGITYPVILDNEYATWNAFGNRYWPRKYLIDVDGYIVYDHIGEGQYDETERAIQKALQELDSRLHMDTIVDTSIVYPMNVITVDHAQLGSPEIYFGSARNNHLANGARGVPGKQTLVVPHTPQLNALYLGGTWTMTPEYAEGSLGSEIVFRYKAKDVYMVASAQGEARLDVLLDGMPAGSMAGEDLSCAEAGNCSIPHSGVIREQRLYKIIEADSYGEHVLRIKVEEGTLQAFTFTFG